MNTKKNIIVILASLLLIAIGLAAWATIDENGNGEGVDLGIGVGGVEKQAEVQTGTGIDGSEVSPTRRKPIRDTFLTRIRITSKGKGETTLNGAITLLNNSSEQSTVSVVSGLAESELAFGAYHIESLHLDGFEGPVAFSGPKTLDAENPEITLVLVPTAVSGRTLSLRVSDRYTDIELQDITILKIPESVRNNERYSIKPPEGLTTLVKSVSSPVSVVVPSGSSQLWVGAPTYTWERVDLDGNDGNDGELGLSLFPAGSIEFDVWGMEDGVDHILATIESPVGRFEEKLKGGVPTEVPNVPVGDVRVRLTMASDTGSGVTLAESIVKVKHGEVSRFSVCVSDVEGVSEAASCTLNVRRRSGGFSRGYQWWGLWTNLGTYESHPFSMKGWTELSLQQAAINGLEGDGELYTQTFHNLAPGTYRVGIHPGGIQQEFELFDGEHSEVSVDLSSLRKYKLRFVFDGEPQEKDVQLKIAWGYSSVWKDCSSAISYNEVRTIEPMEILAFAEPIRLCLAQTSNWKSADEVINLGGAQTSEIPVHLIRRIQNSVDVIFFDSSERRYSPDFGLLSAMSFKSVGHAGIQKAASLQYDEQGVTTGIRVEFDSPGKYTLTVKSFDIGPMAVDVVSGLSNLLVHLP